MTRDHLLNYASLLSSVDNKMQKIIVNSASDFEKSNLIMEELLEQLGKFYGFVRQEREPIRGIKGHLKQNYMGIVRKIVVKQNMEKTLDILKCWR